MINYFSKLRLILTIIFVFLTFIKHSYSNELDNISACAGVVIGDGASELRDLENEKNFDDAFELDTTPKNKFLYSLSSSIKKLTVEPVPMPRIISLENLFLI